jgi:threonine/homoserine/homoserine lactone efflux protein
VPVPDDSLTWLLRRPRGDDVDVTLRRIIGLTVVIAIGPSVLWWLALVIFSDPDEGANIGGGIVGLILLLVSWVLAAAFGCTALLRRRKGRDATLNRP